MESLKYANIENTVRESELILLSDQECLETQGGVLPLILLGVASGVNIVIGCAALGYAAGYVSHSQPRTKQTSPK